MTRTVSRSGRGCTCPHDSTDGGPGCTGDEGESLLFGGGCACCPKVGFACLKVQNSMPTMEVETWPSMEDDLLKLHLESSGAILVDGPK